MLKFTRLFAGWINIFLVDEWILSSITCTTSFPAMVCSFATYIVSELEVTMQFFFLKSVTEEFSSLAPSFTVLCSFGSSLNGSNYLTNASSVPQLQDFKPLNYSLDLFFLQNYYVSLKISWIVEYSWLEGNIKGLQVNEETV